jgi:hypothetical protein
MQKKLVPVFYNDVEVSGLTVEIQRSIEYQPWTIGFAVAFKLDSQLKQLISDYKGIQKNQVFENKLCLYSNDYTSS